MTDSPTIEQDAETLAKKLDSAAASKRHFESVDAGFDSEMDTPVSPLLRQAAAFIRSQASSIQALVKERDEAQSMCTSWENAFGTIEAHIMDRVNMRDPADPDRYLRIIRYDVAHILEDSKRISASRWHDYNMHEKRIASLEAALATERETVERLTEALEPFADEAELWVTDGVDYADADGALFKITIGPTVVTYGDFRRAAAIRARSKEKVNG